MTVLARAASALAFALTLSPIVVTEPVVAQSALTIEALMATPFPIDLVAAPTGGRIAWVSSSSGVHNVLVAEGPDHKWRAVTNYTDDDGLWITDLGWTSDAKTVVYVRGDGANRQGESPNPAQLQSGTEQAVFAVVVDGGTPAAPRAWQQPRAVTPRSTGGVGVSRADLERGSGDNRQGGAARERARQRLGTGVVARWIDAGVHEWPRHAQLHRRLHAGLSASCVTSTRRSIGTATLCGRPTDRRSRGCARARRRDRGMFSPRREVDEPWSLRVADVKTGQARQMWKADAGYGSAFQGIVSDSQLHWGAGDRLVFPWEKDGWLHLYSVSTKGGTATLLTPGNFEVEYVSLAPDRSRMLYNSNQDDIDKRHVWSVPVDGSAKPTRYCRQVGRQRVATGRHE